LQAGGHRFDPDTLHRRSSRTRRPVSDDNTYRTESQKEWAGWAARGYRKMYQPRSMLRFGAVVYSLLIVGLLAVFWLAFNHRLP
jgi:hypothetical protein